MALNIVSLQNVTLRIGDGQRQLSIIVFHSTFTQILNIDALRNLQIETKILFSYYAVGTSHYNSQTT